MVGGTTRVTARPATAACRESVQVRAAYCQCGATLRGKNDDAIVAAVQKHAREVHPEMTITREQALAMAQPDGDKRYAWRCLHAPSGSCQL